MSDERDMELFGRGQLAKQLEEAFGEIVSDKSDHILQRAFSELANGELSPERALGVVAQLASLESLLGTIRRDKKRAVQAGTRMKQTLDNS